MIITKRRFLTSLAALSVAAPALGGCSALGTFNLLVPKDAETGLLAENVSYGDDPRQTLDIYAPRDGRAAADVIVFAYGGSWNSGSKADYSFAARAFAAQGFLTIVFDYRLVPEVRYPVFVQDSARAVAWAHRNVATYGGNPDRLFLVGHSAGAYNVMMVALEPRFLESEGLSPGVIQAAAGLSGPYDFLPLDSDVTRAAFGGTRTLKATQPINAVRRGRKTPPILVVTGDADDTVGPENTTKLAAALRSARHKVEERHYVGIDHAGTLLALSRPLRSRAPVMSDVVTFFRSQ